MLLPGNIPRGSPVALRDSGGADRTPLGPERKSVWACLTMSVTVHGERCDVRPERKKKKTHSESESIKKMLLRFD